MSTQTVAPPPSCSSLKSRQVLQTLVEKFRAGETFIQDAESQQERPIKEALYEAIEAYQHDLRTFLKSQLQTLHEKARKSPEEALGTLHNLQTCVEDTLLPPKKRPRDLLPQIQHLIQEALRWKKRKEQALDIQQQALESQNLARRWLLLVQAHQIYPYLAHLETQLQTVQNQWLKDLQQLHHSLQHILVSPGPLGTEPGDSIIDFSPFIELEKQWHQAQGLLFPHGEILAKEIPAEIDFLLQEVTRLYEQVQRRREAFCRLQETVQYIRKSIERGLLPREIAIQEHLLNSLPEEVREHPAVQHIRQQLHHLADDHQRVEHLLNIVHALALNQAKDEHLRDLSKSTNLAGTWGFLAQAAQRYVEAQEQEKNASFQEALVSYLAALTHFPSTLPSYATKAFLLRNRIQSRLRYLLTTSEPQRWKDWLEALEKAIEGARLSLSSKRFLQSLEQYWHIYQEVTARVPREFRDRWLQIGQKLQELRNDPSKETQDMAVRLHHLLQRIHETLQDDKGSAQALQYIEEARMLSQKIGQSLYFLWTPALFEEQEKILIHIQKNVEMAEKTLNEVAVALRQADTPQDWQQQIEKLERTLIPLRFLQDTESLNTDPFLKKRIDGLMALYDTLSDPDSEYLSLLPKGRTYAQTLSKLRRLHESGNPYASILYESLAQTNLFMRLGRKLSHWFTQISWELWLIWGLIAFLLGLIGARVGILLGRP